MVPVIALLSAAQAILTNAVGDAVSSRVRAGKQWAETRMALAKALEHSTDQFEIRFPGAAAQLFNASFLELEAAPILARCLIPGASQPDGRELAVAWANSIGGSTQATRDDVARADHFLELYRAEIARAPELADLSSRVLEFENAERLAAIQRNTDPIRAGLQSLAVAATRVKRGAQWMRGGQLSVAELVRGAIWEACDLAVRLAWLGATDATRLVELTDRLDAECLGLFEARDSGADLDDCCTAIDRLAGAVLEFLADAGV